MCLGAGAMALLCTTLLAASFARPSIVSRHSPVVATATTTGAFSLLDGVNVLRVTDGASVALNQQWNEEECCALFFFRSFG